MKLCCTSNLYVTSLPEPHIVHRCTDEFWCATLVLLGFSPVVLIFISKSTLILKSSLCGKFTTKFDLANGVKTQVLNSLK